MIVHQNILSKVTVKNVKLSYGNVTFHLEATEIYVVYAGVFKNHVLETSQAECKNKNK